MKVFIVFLVAIFLCAGAVNAQFFEKSAVPGAKGLNSRAITATAAPIIQDFIKPIIGVSASVSTGASLDGGFGVSFQHSKANTVTNAWVIQYSVSALAFIGTNGKKITGTGGLIFGIPGTGGLIQVGPGYDFTQKQLVLLTGVGISIF
jgi:hypothetical protein